MNRFHWMMVAALICGVGIGMAFALLAHHN